MTAADIQAIRDALAAGPTPGPWEWMDNCSLWGAETGAVHAGKTCEEVGHSPTECGPAILGIACEALCNDGEDWQPNEANAAYIAACHPERIARLLAALEDAQSQAKVLRHERDRARARHEWAVQVMSGIHALLYPAPIKAADGRTMVFRPNNPDPHEVLQELSDRIRALPDELAAMKDAP